MPRKQASGTRRSFKTPEVCKPCWELKYCPYGVLVEMMPLPGATEDGKGSWTNPRDQAKLYRRAKKYLRDADLRDDDKLWDAMFFVMFADPQKWQMLERYRPQDVSCNIFGHACPVFCFSYLNCTETREPRKRGRYITRDIMLKVVRRDDHRCQECHEHVRDDEVEFDHLIPHSKGGPLSVANIRRLCRKCNRNKSDSLMNLLDLDSKEGPPPKDT
jgi:hypothetical protein